MARRMKFVKSLVPVSFCFVLIILCVTGCQTSSPLGDFLFGRSVIGNRLSGESEIYLYITSDPPGANIYSGESAAELKWAGTTPKTERFKDRSPYWKKWYYQFKKPGYEDSSVFEKRQGKIGEHQSLTMTLKSIRGTIRCYITTEPSGAVIYYGESQTNLNYTGITPKTFESTAQGSQVNRWNPGYYQFKKPGYQDSPIIFKESGEFGEDIYVYATLEPIAPPPQKPEQKPEDNLIRSGTGWSIGCSYIATCAHVVEDANDIVLLLPDGSKVEARIATIDLSNDVALLSVKNDAKLPPPLPLFDSTAHAGAEVCTMGFPYTGTLGIKPRLTDGVVSSSYGINDDPRTYQISVPVQPGNSGGPLINMKGEVIGLVVSRLDDIAILKTSGTLPQNINYAIKVQYVKTLLETICDQKNWSAPKLKAGNLEKLASQVKKSLVLVIVQ